MDDGTHARVEEERALDSSRLRSSARLGFASASASGTRRKRKKRRRQRRNSPSNVDEELLLAGVPTTVSPTVPTSAITTCENTEVPSAVPQPQPQTQAQQSQAPQEQRVESTERSKNRSGHTSESQRGSGTRAAASSGNGTSITLIGARRAGKRSSRRCNASAGRRNAMTMDLQRLITEVHARPAIWDQKNVNYHNRDVILKMWREIARACEVSTDVAKSKWKHLRDNFRNELKKTYRGKCEGGGSEHDSKWVWFKSLFFLRDQMNSRVIGCALSQNCAAQLRSSPEGTQIEPQIDILEGHEETQFDEMDGDSCQSLLSNDDVGLHHVMPPPKLNKIGRKRTLMHAIENDYAEMDRKRYESLQKRLAVEEEDDTYHFLMSVRNPLRSLPLDRQMFVRLKIQELVYNEINSQNQQHGQQMRGCEDVKPARVSGTGNCVVNALGGGPTGEAVSEMSSAASMLQDCNSEASGDNSYYG